MRKIKAEGPPTLKPISMDVEFDRVGLPINQEKLRLLKRKYKLVDEPANDVELPDYSNRRGKPYKGLIEGPMFDDQGFPFSGEPVMRVPLNLKDIMKDTNVYAYAAKVQAASERVFFDDFLKIVKAIFPTMKMTLPKPPTYTWSEGTPGEDDEEEKKLDIQKIKDSLQVRLPSLKWQSDELDGSEVAEMEFPDSSYVQLAIGKKAIPLTITYYMSEELGESEEG